MARYGGEEFTVILPNCSLDDAVRVAERMRSGLPADACAGHGHPERGRGRDPRQRADEESLIAAADEAMYTSKRTGRDRTTRSTRPGPQVPAFPR